MHFPAREEAKMLWRLLEYLGQRGVSNWNDYPGRTKEQVVAALRGAARA